MANDKDGAAMVEVAKEMRAEVAEAAGQVVGWIEDTDPGDRYDRVALLERRVEALVADLAGVAGELRDGEATALTSSLSGCRADVDELGEEVAKLAGDVGEAAGLARQAWKLAGEARAEVATLRDRLGLLQVAGVFGAAGGVDAGVGGVDARADGGAGEAGRCKCRGERPRTEVASRPVVAGDGGCVAEVVDEDGARVLDEGGVKLRQTRCMGWVVDSRARGGL